jgi:hypothetical protein
MLDDDVPWLLLVVDEQDLLRPDERHPLPVGAPAFVRDAVPERPAGREVPAVVR